MIIELHISNTEIDAMSNVVAGQLTLQDFKERPRWFIENSDSIIIRGKFGVVSEDAK